MRLKTVYFCSVALWLSMMAAMPVVSHSMEGLEKLPESREAESLQRGAMLFVNYCLGCHSLKQVRLTQLSELKLSVQQIKENLLLNGGNEGETLTISFSPADAKAAFGVFPPDLSLTARSRSSALGTGGDWIYTYLRQFYRDAEQPFGWNNRLVQSSVMPHALYRLEGLSVGVDGGNGQKRRQTEILGELTPLEYDEAVRDLTHFLVYVSDPIETQRKSIGLYSLAFLFVLFVLIYAVKTEFWKKIH